MPRRSPSPTLRSVWTSPYILRASSSFFSESGSCTASHHFMPKDPPNRLAVILTLPSASVSPDTSPGSTLTSRPLPGNVHESEALAACGPSMFSVFIPDSEPTVLERTSVIANAAGPCATALTSPHDWTRDTGEPSVSKESIPRSPRTSGTMIQPACITRTENAAFTDADFPSAATSHSYVAFSTE